MLKFCCFFSFQMKAQSLSNVFGKLQIKMNIEPDDKLNEISHIIAFFVASLFLCTLRTLNVYGIRSLLQIVFCCVWFSISIYGTYISHRAPNWPSAVWNGTWCTDICKQIAITRKEMDFIDMLEISIRQK